MEWLHLHLRQIDDFASVLHTRFHQNSLVAWWPTIFSRSAKSWPYPTTESFQAAKE